MNLDRWKPEAEHGAIIWRRNRFGVSLVAYYSNLSAAYEWMAIGATCFRTGKSRSLKLAMAAALRAARSIVQEEGWLES